MQARICKFPEFIIPVASRVHRTHSCRLLKMMAPHSVSVAVLGASGYSGMELLRLLLGHPRVNLAAVTSRSFAGRTVAQVFPRFRGAKPGSEVVFTEPNAAELAAVGVEFAFLALPHGVSTAYAKPLLAAGVRVIDLSADFRLRDAAVYEEFYGEPHAAPELLEEAVYGLPEHRAEEIRTARLVASPGCFPTSILTPLLPLVRAGIVSTQGISVFSMSGVSGAGRKESLPLLFCECTESLRAYGLPKHRHLSEIEQELSLAAGEKVVITFLPHLVPVRQGIATTIACAPADGADLSQIAGIFAEAYVDCPFVRVLGENQMPDTKNVTGTNFIDLGWAIDQRANRLILLSAEDNLGKGAAAQAVQSLNLMAGFDPAAGLKNF